MTSSRSGVPRGSGYGMAPMDDRFHRGRPSPAVGKVMYFDQDGKVIDKEAQPELHAAAVELESNRVLSVTEERKRAAKEAE